MLIVELRQGRPVIWSPSFVSRETFQQASDWQTKDCDRYSCFPHKVQETNNVCVAPDGCHLWFFMKCLNDYWMSWGIRFNNYDDPLKSSSRLKPFVSFFFLTRSNPIRSLIAPIFILYALFRPSFPCSSLVWWTLQISGKPHFQTSVYTWGREPADVPGMYSEARQIEIWFVFVIDQILLTFSSAFAEFVPVKHSC